MTATEQTNEQQNSTRTEGATNATSKSEDNMEPERRKDFERRRRRTNGKGLKTKGADAKELSGDLHTEEPAETAGSPSAEELGPKNCNSRRHQTWAAGQGTNTQERELSP